MISLLGAERLPDESTALATTVVKPDASRQYTRQIRSIALSGLAARAISRGAHVRSCRGHSCLAS